jgi:hypothetical protein
MMEKGKPGWNIQLREKKRQKISKGIGSKNEDAVAQP